MQMAADKDDLKRRIEAEHPEWKQPKNMPRPIASVVGSMLQVLPTEDYAKDPWWIMRVQPNAYASAANSLKREGFESYGPTYKVLGPMPLRMIPPKKRHQSGLYKREVRKRRFEGYLFIRRMFGRFDVNRLFDLDGCGSIVKDGERNAIVFDYEVELMRLAEVDGTFDEVQVETYRGYKVNRLDDDRQWTGQTKVIGRLDDSNRTVLFVERMGRIARLISEAGQQ